jgi:uncharacterized damage-inducible protein DinB
MDYLQNQLYLIQGQNMTISLPFPDPDEYATFYDDYIQRAIARKDVLAALPLQLDELHAALDSLSDEQALYKFGPAEWSIKELMSHLIDGERVFSYRLLRISRGDETPLSGFEQEPYVRASGADGLAFKDLLQEFEFLRRANILAVHNMSTEATLRRGTASDAVISARALIYIMVGHVEHHMACLHEKYLPALK